MTRHPLHAVFIIIASTMLISCVAESIELHPDLAEAVAWYTGTSGQVDDRRAKTLLSQAASDGDIISRMWIARVYSRGRMGFDENADSAQAIATDVITDVEDAAGRGMPEAIFLMGTAYAEGLGKVQNDETAVGWYRKAADLGNVLAQHNMGNVYFSGTGVPQNDSLAVYWWTKAARRGDAIPQFRIGLMYEQGRGVKRDLDEARRWYEDSAGRGNDDAAEALTRLDPQ